MNLASKSRILVIDDDPAMRDMVATHLTRIEALIAVIEPANVQPQPDDPLCSLAELERRHVARVLERVGGNKAAAARILGIERKTLYRMLDRWSALGDNQECVRAIEDPR
jgi:DNA-binding NtrC family response regulator